MKELITISALFFPEEIENPFDPSHPIKITIYGDASEETAEVAFIRESDGMFMRPEWCEYPQFAEYYSGGICAHVPYALLEGIGISTDTGKQTIKTVVEAEVTIPICACGKVLEYSWSCECGEEE